tara:strand:+ start:987 stop:1814 length:828 start_codon:yes stop_codon:yes gene_type:complete
MEYMLGKEKNISHHATILPMLVAMFGKPNMVMAEVGVWDGNSLAVYLNTLKSLNGKVYLIDWWKGSKYVGDGLNMKWKDEIYEKEYQQVLNIVETCDAKDNVVILRGDSTDMAKHIKDGELDLCFIDAGHSHEECLKDIKSYFPKVKKGGIMSGDDLDTHSLLLYLAQANSFTEEELKTDAVKGIGHPGVLQAVFDCFHDNIVPFNDGWYTFAGYRIVRGCVGVIEEEKASLLDDNHMHNLMGPVHIKLMQDIINIERDIELEFKYHSNSIEPKF